MSLGREGTPIGWGGATLWCKAHPTYKAMRYPKGGCATCIVLWKLMEEIRSGAIEHVGRLWVSNP